LQLVPVFHLQIESPKLNCRTHINKSIIHCSAPTHLCFTGPVCVRHIVWSFLNERQFELLQWKLDRKMRSARPSCVSRILLAKKLADYFVLPLHCSITILVLPIF
jgi:hypothetical protein